MTAVVIFSRVSKQSQDYERQIFELQEHAQARGYQVVEVISEKLSGRTLTKNRPQLQHLLQLATTRKIKKVLIWEVSRLGRKTSEVLKILEQLTELGVGLYVHTYQLETLLPDGKRNPLAQFLITILADIARMESETLSDRIHSGLQAARRKGKKLGRPEGSVLDNEQLQKKYPKVVKELKKGTSIRRTAKLCDVAEGTVKKVKAAIAPKN